jgi:EAL domain-containing protein (putative c-di-GMP-specific phosphodiesterase class I)
MHLKQLGCDLAQGYMFARPSPPELLDAMLLNDSAPPTGLTQAA